MPISIARGLAAAIASAGTASSSPENLAQPVVTYTHSRGPCGMALIRQPARMASTGTAGTGVALPLTGVGIALPNPATSTYPRTPPRWAIRTA